jgi:hypothetical protein
VNILDLSDLKSGEHYGTYAYRLLGRHSTAQLRLMEIYWTGNKNPHDEPKNATRQHMEKVGFLRRWPLITRVWRAPDDAIGVVIEGRAEPFYLLDGDQIVVLVA